MISKGYTYEYQSCNEIFLGIGSMVIVLALGISRVAMRSALWASLVTLALVCIRLQASLLLHFAKPLPCPRLDTMAASLTDTDCFSIQSYPSKNRLWTTSYDHHSKRVFSSSNFISLRSSTMCFL